MFQWKLSNRPVKGNLNILSLCYHFFHLGFCFFKTFSFFLFNQSHATKTKNPINSKNKMKIQQESKLYMEIWMQQHNITEHNVHVTKPSVPDRRRRIVLEVVLVRRWVTWVLGIWRGEGLGKGLTKGRSVYKQPETEVDGSCHS